MVSNSSASPPNFSLGFLSQAVTSIPARSKVLMSGVLDTPMPMTATRFP